MRETLIGQKMKMAAAAVLAVALAFLLVGMSYILFPEQTSQEPPTPIPIPKPEPLLDQILWAIQWIGLAAFIAITVVGAVLLMNRIRGKKTPKDVGRKNS